MVECITHKPTDLFANIDKAEFKLLQYHGWAAEASGHPVEPEVLRRHRRWQLGPACTTQHRRRHAQKEPLPSQDVDGGSR